MDRHLVPSLVADLAQMRTSPLGSALRYVSRLGCRNILLAGDPRLAFC
jgi:hypothetical protein